MSLPPPTPGPSTPATPAAPEPETPETPAAPEPVTPPPPAPSGSIGPSIDIAVLTLRAMFFVSAVGLGLYLANSFGSPEYSFYSMLVAGFLAVVVIAVDGLAVAKSSIATVSAVVFGLLIGFLTAQLFVGIVSLVGDYEGPQGAKLLNALRMAITLIFCYLGPAYLLRTKDDLRFIVPYVEFQPQSKAPRPLVLDTSAIIDGRIVDLARARLFDVPVLVPRYVVEELQRIADSHDKNRRERGRKGLERLKTLQDMPGVEVQLLQVSDAPEAEVDRRLIELAKARRAKLVTVDWNLEKVCDLEGVPVLNVNQLAEALRAQVVAGDILTVKIVRPGEGKEQGVGYLQDGTMVVVEGAKRRKGETVAAVVSSAIQSSAGRMVFARLEGDTAPGPAAPGAPAAPAPAEPAEKSDSQRAREGGA